MGCALAGGRGQGVHGLGRHRRGPAHSHRGRSLSCGALTNRACGAPDRRHRPSADAGRRAASGGGRIVTTPDAGRKRLEANMIAGPAWVLNRRAFAAATGAARASA
jgi:hypothetical protein